MIHTQRFSVKLRCSHSPNQIPVSDEYTTICILLKRAKIMRKVHNIAVVVTIMRSYLKDYVCVYDDKCTVNV